MKPATAAVWFIALLPTFIAAWVLKDADWGSASNVLGALGRMTGISGLGFLLVSAGLSSRVPGFDRGFGGLTKLWQTHHVFGGIALLLLLAHPLLLAFARAQSPGAAGELLFPPLSAWAMWAGWGGLVLMILFLGPSFSFFGEPQYQRWKFIHKLAGPAIVLALVHAFALDRTIPPPLDYVVWGSLAVLAMAALGYRWLFSRTHLPGTGGRLPYQVERVEPVCQGVVELSLKPLSRPLKYEAGQFVYLTPFDRTLKSGYREEHPFTLSSSPHESVLRITIKDLGDASRAIQNVQAGTEARVEGPYGAFFEPNDGHVSELWIAGGIGVTPFLGRARELRQQGSNINVCLVFCVQDEARALFREELTAIAAALPAFQFFMHYFYKEGPLSADFISARCSDFPSRRVYICGPTPLLVLARKVALQGGVSGASIHTEEFNLL